MREPYNYLRKASEYLEHSFIPAMEMKGANKESDTFREILARAKSSQKFILPNSGKIFDDGLKGLPEVLKLPFDSIVIEYSCYGLSGVVETVYGSDSCVKVPKRIVYAEQDEDEIVLFSIIGTQDGVWMFQPWGCVITINANGEVLVASENEAGKVIEGLYTYVFKIGSLAEQAVGIDWETHAYYDMQDELGAVLELIEALSCCNVAHELLPARKMSKNAIKKGAIKFDSYRILTIGKPSNNKEFRGDANGRSPREHLRRGHIRNLSDGRRLWVNSCVVNAGVGGKVVTVRDMRVTA